MTRSERLHAMRDALWASGPAILSASTWIVCWLSAVVQVVLVGQKGWPVAGLVAVGLSIAGLAVALRWRYPAVVLVGLGVLAGGWLGWEVTGLWSIATFIAFLVCLLGSSGLTVGALLASASFAANVLQSGSATLAGDPLAFGAAFAVLASAAAGSAVRNHAAYLQELHRRTADAVAARQSAVDRSVAEERMRIARDLHDSVGQHIAVVNMMLGAAEVHLPADADASRRDLVAARSAVRDVLAETQQILKVMRLREEDVDGRTSVQSERIPELLETFRAAGMVIDAHLAELTMPVPADVSAAAYRVVQEALTNAQRHGTGEAVVMIETDAAGDLIVDVSNPTRHESTPSHGQTGYGLVGMRERVQSVGGALDVSAQSGRFRVRVRLPLGGVR